RREPRRQPTATMLRYSFVSLPVIFQANGGCAEPAVSSPTLTAHRRAFHQLPSTPSAGSTISLI
ncbi:MAG TPA: hypothetical protein VJ901_18640, partial [Thermoanaerobaculia bacterium]|nr:hypothetical protein [Thermoanaerobaculia bacterium]